MRGGIVYISSNREKPEFEQKITQDMLAKRNGMPVFSVTQKAMPYMGINKAIGDVGTSGFNFCRQLQMAVAAVPEEYDYVVSCEADCLYSPDYFTFVPPEKGKVYRNTNIYLLRYKADYFSRKSSQTAFQIADRRFLLDRLNFLLKGQPQWDVEQKNFPKEIGQPFLEEWEEFATEFGCFGIKTGEGMRKHSSAGNTKIYDIPYWGSAKGIRKKFDI